MLTDEDIVCRRVSRNPARFNKKTGRPETVSFQLASLKDSRGKKIKPPEYEDGLSCDVVRLLPNEIAHLDSTDYIYFSLRVGDVRSIGLDVVLDAVDESHPEYERTGENLAHALIVGWGNPRDKKVMKELTDLAFRSNPEV